MQDNGSDEKAAQMVGIFQQLFTELVEKRHVKVRPANLNEHEPPGAYAIENPRNPDDILYMSPFGMVFHFNKHTRRHKALHSKEAPADRRLKIILDAFQIG